MPALPLLLKRTLAGNRYLCRAMQLWVFIPQTKREISLSENYYNYQVIIKRNHSRQLRLPPGRLEKEGKKTEEERKALE